MSQPSYTPSLKNPNIAASVSTKFDDIQTVHLKMSSTPQARSQNMYMDVNTVSIMQLSAQEILNNAGCYIMLKFLMPYQELSQFPHPTKLYNCPILWTVHLTLLFPGTHFATFSHRSAFAPFGYFVRAASSAFCCI